MSYRSGRFGFSADARRRRSSGTGYLVESSVAPLFYEAHKGGPDFVEAPLAPYFLAYDSATAPGHAATCSRCRCRRRSTGAAAAARSALYARAPRPVHDQAGAAEARRRCGCVAAAVLLVARRHDGARAAPRRATACRVLNLLFHSSEAIVGGSPYNRTQAELDAFLRSARAVPGVRRRRARRRAGHVRASSATRSRAPPGSVTR